MFDRVQVQALAGPLKDIQRLVPKPLLCCLGCVLRVVVLLEGPERTGERIQGVGRGSPILLYRSSQALSDWMWSVAAQLISGLPRDVRSRASPGAGWATQGH